MAWEDEIIVPDVASAGLHVSERIGRDVATSQLDLEESLEASRYTSHPYSSHPKEWPALVEAVETRDLPSILIERYNSIGGEGITLCGIFSDLHRAWASVDNSLFIWRYDKWDGQPQEYKEEQPIYAVGLARAKPGVFIEAIQFLLVLATPLEIILVGVCCTGSADGTDPYAELALQPLPEYRILSEGVSTVCFACTDRGRVFLAGRDGHVYELHYTSGSGWSKRFRMNCVTSNFVSRVLHIPNTWIFGAADPIIDMVTDEERHILYARTEGSKLLVFDLGETGEGQFHKVTEEKTLADPRDSRARRSASQLRPSICCISPLSRTESKRLNLFTVLSDGRRLYLSTMSSPSSLQRPDCLKVIATRPSPPIGFGQVSSQAHPLDDLAVKADTAFYSFGMLVLSEISSNSSSASSLITVQRDSTAQAPPGTGMSGTVRNSRALRETVLAIQVDGLMLCAADVAPNPEASSVVQTLYADVEPQAALTEPLAGSRSALKLWAKGDLSTQHILPRRRIIVFKNLGLTELAVNRPVDILRKILESNGPRSQVEEFFNRFGPGESAAMCLIIASRLLYNEEETISNTVCERAADAFEDPNLVGTTRSDTGTGFGTSTSTGTGFSMGQVVRDSGPVFSGAYEGLCLCSSRLLLPVWDFPVFVENRTEGLIMPRLTVGAIRFLEGKVRSLELFLRSRRNKRKGMYGFVAGLGDYNYSGGSILSNRGDYGNYTGNNRIGSSAKRQRPLYTSAELAAMEVRAMECLRRLLRRSGEALFLLQIACQHNATRLIQSLNLDTNSRQKLVQLTFHQFVCTEEGDQIAMSLISSLMEYYVGSECRGTVDDISTKLREGCPSYFDKSDYTLYVAIERLERAAVASRDDERESFAREAFELLMKIPDPANLGNLCRRFENLRFYEAVVRLPLQKAQALHSNSDTAISLKQREECYSIIADALRNLKGGGRAHALDQTTRNKYVRQIVQLSVQWPDTEFHEYLYKTLIELGLENELLEFGGSDLVFFLQSAGRKAPQESRAGAGIITSTPTRVRDVETHSSSTPTKYLDLLARYYVLKGQHLQAAYILLRLAEKPFTESLGPTLEQRYQYLSNAVLQAKTAGSSVGSTRNTIDEDLLNILEGKLAVLRFQIRIKEELESAASRSARAAEGESATSSSDPMPCGGLLLDAEFARVVREKAHELSLELKNITQLYNDYAVPFKLWEVCLEMLNFANYTGETDPRIVQETWARLLDQSILSGGVKEACSVIKRVGSTLTTGDGSCLPLDFICLHLEKSALERETKGIEIVGDEEIPRSLINACCGAYEQVIATYDRILSNGAVLPSLNLKLRLLRSAFVTLREWGSAAASAGPSLAFSGSYLAASGGARDKIISFANRFMTEVRRLPLPQSQTESIYRGFRELDEQLLAPLYHSF